MALLPSSAGVLPDLSYELERRVPNDEPPLDQVGFTDPPLPAKPPVRV